MKTLHELAIKLQEYIIKCQQDAHNSTNMNITKYNNLKLRIDTTLHYPNIIVTIGISEGIWNFKDGTKTDGSLGPDEKYVRKWLGSSTVIADLKEIYLAASELVKAEDEKKAVSIEGEADEAKKDQVRKRRKFKSLLETAMPAGTEDAETEQSTEEGEDVELLSDEEENDLHPKSDTETVDALKTGLKDILKSMFRRK